MNLLTPFLTPFLGCAGNGLKAICCVSNVLRSPSPDPRRSAVVMKSKCIPLLLFLGFVDSSAGQSTFTNLDFESASVVVNEPTFGFLDWNLAAPGWNHSGGNDLGIIYYRQEHLGLTGYYILYDSLSPADAPGTQLAGSYSLGFASGSATHFGGGWQENYLSQSGTVASDVRSFRLLARGPFEVFVGGALIPMQALGDDLYAGDVSSFAGTTTDFRIVNTSRIVHTEVIVDNISFSSMPVPEPSVVAVAGAGFLVWMNTRRRGRTPKRGWTTAGAVAVVGLFSNLSLNHVVHAPSRPSGASA